MHAPPPKSLEAGNAEKKAGAPAENHGEANPPKADNNIVPQLGGGSSISKSKTSSSELKIKKEKSDTLRGNKKATLPPKETVASDDININLEE